MKRTYILSILAAAAAMAVTGCQKELIDKPGGGAGGALRFKTTISSKEWSGGAKSGANAAPQTRAPLFGTDFPSSASGTTHNIGLFLMKDLTTPIETGSGNMVAELTKTDGAADAWRYQYGGVPTWIDQLSLSSGKEHKVYAYYPYHLSANVQDGISFDLTTSGQQDNQTDLLYSPEQRVTPEVGVPADVMLNFKHAYALLEFRIKKTGSPAANFSHVEVANAAGKSWIVNKGTLQPRDGTIGNTTAGNVRVVCNETLSIDSYTTIRVMVPPFAGAYADGDIQILFTESGGADVQPFMLKQAHLSAVTGGHGLKSGTRYAFKLLYDNVGSGALDLQGWEIGGADDIIGALPSTLEVDENGILVLKKEGAERGKMLIFKFGGVVGFTQEGAWAADRVLFNPTANANSAFANYTSIPVYMTADWDANRRNISDAAYHNGTNIKSGKGDPCKLVGLTAEQIKSMTTAELDSYDSGWRLPTVADNKTFTGQTGNVNSSAHWTASDSRYDKWYYSTGSAGGYFPKGQESQKNNYLPAAGYRGYSDGAPSNIGTYGSFWSSEVYSSAYGYLLNFYSGRVHPEDYYNYAYGYGVRCVSTTP